MKTSPRPTSPTVCIIEMLWHVGLQIIIVHIPHFRFQFYLISRQWQPSFPPRNIIVIILLHFRNRILHGIPRQSLRRGINHLLRDAERTHRIRRSIHRVKAIYRTNLVYRGFLMPSPCDLFYSSFFRVMAAIAVL